MSPNASPFREERIRCDEARRVLRRALERSHAAAEGGATISKSELLQIAEQLGIDESVLQRSYDDAERPPDAELDGGIWGAPRELCFEASIDGELSTSRHEAAADIIRGEIDEVGRVEILGSSFTWTTVAMNAQPRALSVRLRARDGMTSVRIHESLSQIRLGAWLGIGLGVGFGSGACAAVFALRLGRAGAGLAFLLLALLGLCVARLTCQTIARRRAKQLSRLHERLKDELIQVKARSLS